MKTQETTQERIERPLHRLVIPPDIRKSMWFQKGQEEGKKRTPIKKTIVFKLRFGCRQQDDFLLGYDNPNA